MGCCLSTHVEDVEKTKNKLNDYYVATSSKRHPSKRSYFAYNSNGSSAVFSSVFTSRSQRPVSTCCSSTPSSIQIKVKAKNFIASPKNVPAPSEILTICDDFHEAVKIQTHQENKSYGYYSESLSTESNASTPTQSGLIPQVCCSCPKSPYIALTPPPSNMEMEMYMMSRSQRIILKTSSPISQRKDLTYNHISAASPSSYSYQKWAKYLHTAPISLLHNVTDIPEALAGHFSPLHFPAFIDLEEMESAAKRFKVDIQQNRIRKVDNFNPILITDL